MFSYAVRRFVQGVSLVGQSSIRTLNTVVKPYESLSVKTYGVYDISITGKVLNIFTFDNGSLSFYIRSVCLGNFPKTHKVCIVNKHATLLELAKEKLKVDHRVYVAGKLSTSRFNTHDGKHRSTSAILASEICIFDKIAVANNSKYSNPEHAEPIDENSVHLAGTISTDIVGDNFKSFTLASLKTAGAPLSNPANLSFNRIFVNDKSLFPLLQDVRVKKDEFFLRGEISYRNYKNNYGKMVPSAYITATQLYRI